MIKLIASILSISAFLSYQYALVTCGVDLSELYFVAMGLSISVFCFMSIRKDDKGSTSSFMVLCGTFHIITVLVYLYRWVLLGDGSTNYYTAFCLSVIITIIYILIDTFYGHKPNPNEL